MHSYLEQIVHLINQYSTTALVIITGIYAYFTYRMARVMSQQILSKIEVCDTVVGSSLLYKDIAKIIIDIDKKTISRSLFDFYVRAHFLNKAAGPGSITKPVLELKFSDGYTTSVMPETKSYHYTKIDETTSECETQDSGDTLSIAGGGLDTLELHYFCNLDDKLLNHLKEDVNPHYFITFINNLGKKYLFQITNIISDDEFERQYL